MTNQEDIKERKRKYFRNYYKLNKKEILFKQKNDIKRKVRRIKYDREHRLKNKEYYKRLDKNKVRKLKIEVLNHYSNNLLKCACCDESILEFLSIDHINGGGNKHFKELNKIGVNFYKWLKNNSFPIGYQVLCMNCNFAKGHFKTCPHRRMV